MASVTNRHGNRNLWIILGTCLGAIVVAIIVSVVWICKKRSRRTSITQTVFHPRTVTPLDDAEFESWRRPSEYTQRTARYTVMPKKPLPIARVNTHSTFEKEDEQSFIERPQTPPNTNMVQSPNFSRPRSSHKSTRPLGKRRGSSIYSVDRPPTPYSPSRSEKESTVGELTSPASPPRSKPSHHQHYPSVSDTSDFDFDFEKTNVDYRR